jgi:hypothetical protein
MKSFLFLKTLVCSLFMALGLFNVAFAQTRTPWEMHYGEGVVGWSFDSLQHGAIVEYDSATIPTESDPGWGPAPDQDIISYSQVPSTLCGGVMDCRYGADFTYFQTFVVVPSNVVVTEFTIAFAGIDDGARVTIFNSTHPGGVVVPGSYVFLGSTGTCDLSALVNSGEVNRVVVTHTDDCCLHSYLSSAVVVLNGEIVDIPVDVGIDIKFCSDPNAFNCKKKGVLPVTIFGTEDFYVEDIDISTLQLCTEDLSVCTGAPSDYSIADRGDPTSDLGAAQCTLLEVDEGIFEEQDYLNPDGFLDLDVAFEASEVQDMLGTFCGSARNAISETLVIIGSTLGGAPFISVPIGNTGTDQLVKKN